MEESPGKGNGVSVTETGIPTVGSGPGKREEKRRSDSRGGKQISLGFGDEISQRKKRDPPFSTFSIGPTTRLGLLTSEVLLVREWTQTRRYVGVRRGVESHLRGKDQ